MPPFASPASSEISNHYDFGRKLLQEQKFDSALTAFEAALAERPGHPDTQFQIGRVLLEMLRAEEAMSWLKTAAEQKSDVPQVWMAWAEAVALGGTKRDRSEYTSAVKASPLPSRQIKTLVDRFGAHRKGSKPSLAGLSPKDIQNLIARMEAGDLNKAHATAKALLKKAPKAAVVANILGEVNARMGALDASIAARQHAIKLDAGYTEAYIALGQTYFQQGEWIKAAKVLRLAVILSPDALAALIGLGTSLIRSDYLKAGISYLQRAVSQDPKNASVWSELAYGLLRYDNFNLAVEAFEAAIKHSKSPVPPDLYGGLANALESTERDAEALEVLEKVLVSDPGHLNALMVKAGIFQSQGKFEEARDIFKQVIADKPTYGEPYWHLSMSMKMEANDPLIAKMERIFEQPDLSDNDRMNLGFALSKAMVDVGSDHRVFPYLNTANALSAAISVTSRNRRFEVIRRCRDVYGPIDFHAIPPVAESAIAPIFVTGLPRSGTTLIEQIIAAHSTVKACGELGYVGTFTQDFLKPSPDQSQCAVNPEALADVQRNYTTAIEQRFPGAKIITDKALLTFQHIGPLKRALPNARFIVVRRDPRDNLLSMYRNKFKDGTQGYSNNMVTLAKFYNEFDKTIQFWRDRVPDWFYEVSYDALVADPEPEARKLIEACGLEWEDDCLDFHNAKMKVKTLSLYQVRQPISTASLKGWKRFEKDLQPMIDQLKKDGHVSD